MMACNRNMVSSFSLKYLIISLALADGCTPPAGYTQSGDSGNFYYKLTTVSETRDEAKVRCEADNAHLTFYKTLEEYNSIKALIGNNEYWTGLDNPNGVTCYDAFSCGNQLKWLDGTNFVYDTWMWEMSKADSGLTCFLTMMSTSVIGNDDSCTLQRPAICQFDCANSCSPPSGYSSHGASGVNYYKITTSGTHAISKARCETDNAHLAYYKTPEQYANIISLADAEDLWIGLDNPSNIQCMDSASCSNQLEWLDGTDFVHDPSFMFLSTKANEGNMCFLAMVGNAAVADDMSCSLSRKALCHFQCGAEPMTTTTATVTTTATTTAAAIGTTMQGCGLSLTKWTLEISIGSCSQPCSIDCNGTINVCVEEEGEDFPLHEVLLCLCAENTEQNC